MSDRQEKDFDDPITEFLFDDSEIDMIAPIAARFIMHDDRYDCPLSPAEALAAIRRFDLSGFDWCPKSDEEFRLFLSRYVPFSILQSFLQFTGGNFEGFMGAWEPGSQWCLVFMRMLALARHGAVRAYEAMLAEEAGGGGGGEHEVSEITCEKAPACDVARHKGVKTIQ